MLDVSRFLDVAEGACGLWRGAQSSPPRPGVIVSALVALIVALFVTAVPASASTTITVEDGSPDFPYQSWVDEANVPTPDLSISVVENTEACNGPALGCTDQATTLSLSPCPACDGGQRKTFLHELGHVDDAFRLTPETRLSFLSLINRPGLAWSLRGEPHSARAGEEWFADTYSICARKPRIRPRRWYDAGDAPIRGLRLRPACAFIRAI
jgi:hypothetical protein